MPSEHSVLSSLLELRAIEQQRLADEHAIRTARAAAIEAERVLAEERREASERARRQAEADEAAREQQALEAARRADEVAVACAEAAARARAAAELEAARLADEMRIRREQLARTRPVGLIAILAALVVAAGVLVALFVQQRADLDERAAAIRQIHDRVDEMARDRDSLVRTAGALQTELDHGHAQLDAKAAEIARLQHAATTAAAGSAPPVAHRPPPTPMTGSAAHPHIVVDPTCADTPLGCLDRK